MPTLDELTRASVSQIAMQFGMRASVLQPIALDQVSANMWRGAYPDARPSSPVWHDFGRTTPAHDERWSQWKAYHAPETGQWGVHRLRSVITAVARIDLETERYPMTWPDTPLGKGTAHHTAIELNNAKDVEP